MGYSMEGGMKYGEKDFNLTKLLKNQPYLIIKSQLKGVVTVKQNILKANFILLCLKMTVTVYSIVTVS